MTLLLISTAALLVTIAASIYIGYVAGNIAGYRRAVNTFLPH